MTLTRQEIEDYCRRMQFNEDSIDYKICQIAARASEPPTPTEVAEMVDWLRHAEWGGAKERLGKVADLLEAQWGPSNGHSMESAPRNGDLFMVWRPENVWAQPCFRRLEECDDDGNCADGGGWMLIEGCPEDGGNHVATLFIPDSPEQFKWLWYPPQLAGLEPGREARDAVIELALAKLYEALREYQEAEGLPLSGVLVGKLSKPLSEIFLKVERVLKSSSRGINTS